MGYLATSNTSTPTPAPPAKITQFLYTQSTSSASFNGYLSWSKALFTASAAGCVNTTDTLLTAATNSSSNVTVPGVQFPASGVWCLSWGARFTATSAENDAWFHVISSKTYGETGTTGAANVRLGATSTTAYNTTTTWTGYVDAGDVLGLCVYSAASNTLQSGASYGASLVAVLLQPAA